MSGVEALTIRDLLGHSSVTMTDRYMHSDRADIHDAVNNLGFSARFQHTENLKKAVLYQNGLVTTLNGRGERI